MFKKALLLVLVLPMLSAAAVPADTQPETMRLSSWVSTTSGGEITGGTQSVTIISTSTVDATGFTFDLGAAPCDCSIQTSSTSAGFLEDGVWLVADLAAGASVTLDLMYVANS
jgi:hypothetical protein